LYIDYTNIIAAAAAAPAIFGVLWGVYQYTKGQTTTRQKVLFKAIKEFNESKEMQIAKDVLSYGYVRRPKEKKKENDQHQYILTYYSKTNLETILRSPKKDTTMDYVTDPAEIDIRNSFDSLIVFLGKIGYLLGVRAITLDETLYFQYYIHKTHKDKEFQAVQEYIDNYDFPLYKILIEELDRHSKWYLRFTPKKKKFDKYSFAGKGNQYKVLVDHSFCILDRY
jgi:hypothetical protein